MIAKGGNGFYETPTLGNGEDDWLMVNPTMSRLCVNMCLWSW